MSAVKEPMRHSSSSPRTSRTFHKARQSPFLQNKRDLIQQTSSLRKHRASCARRLLCQSPSLKSDVQKDAVSVSVCITPCSPKSKDSPISRRSPRQQTRLNHLQEPSRRDFENSGNAGWFPFSPSKLDALFLSPTSCRSPSSVDKLSSPLYTPDRKDVFLGRGSFGNVTLCHYKSHKFALKVINNSSKSEVGEKNLLNIRHDHLVRILHVAEVKDKVFICMEFAGHCNLQQLLDSKGYLDFKRRISFSRQVASGLAHCHSFSIVHRDVKPANVIVSPSGLCRLGDFGHSMKLDGSIYTVPALRVPSPKGTVSYTAPEVLRGLLPSFASDVYSLGVTLWQIQSREIPFAGEHPHAIIYKVVSSNTRPEFYDSRDDPILIQFIKITKVCWDECPDQRPEAQEVVHAMMNLLNSWF